MFFSNEGKFIPLNSSTNKFGLLSGKQKQMLSKNYLRTAGVLDNLKIIFSRIYNCLNP